MSMDRKKELKDGYKTREVIGGVCCIKCNGNQRVLIKPTRDIGSLRNRFNFAITTKTCPDPALRSEWREYGIKSFSFKVLEEIKKGEGQSDGEFMKDINTLYEMWQEKQ